jgi:hypothetical protein
VNTGKLVPSGQVQHDEVLNHRVLRDLVVLFLLSKEIAMVLKDDYTNAVSAGTILGMLKSKTRPHVVNDVVEYINQYLISDMAVESKEEVKGYYRWDIDIATIRENLWDSEIVKIKDLYMEQGWSSIHIDTKQMMVSISCKVESKLRYRGGGGEIL